MQQQGKVDQKFIIDRKIAKFLCSLYKYSYGHLMKNAKNSATEKTILVAEKISVGDFIVPFSWQSEKAENLSKIIKAVVIDSKNSKHMFVNVHINRDQNGSNFLKSLCNIFSKIL